MAKKISKVLASQREYVLRPFALLNHTHEFYANTVDTIAARDAIEGERRYEGAIYYVKADQTTYQLRGGSENSDWVVLVSAGGASSHLDLTNIGTNTHAQIDTHIADSDIHFTMASISITESQISDLQSYALDSHTHTEYLGISDSAVSADALATTGAVVDVSAAAPPVAGQVLTATSPTAATWQNAAAAGIGDIIQTGSPVDTYVGYFSADKNLTGDAGFTWITASARLNVIGATPEFRLQDNNNPAATMIAELSFWDSTAVTARIRMDGTGNLRIENTAGEIRFDTGTSDVVVSGNGDLSVGNNLDITGYISSYGGTPVNGSVLQWVTANGQAEFITGSVTATGTPLAQEVAVYSAAAEIQAYTNFTYSGTILAVNGLTWDGTVDQLTLGGADLTTPGIEIDGSLTATPYLNFSQNSVVQAIIRYSNANTALEISSTADNIKLRPGNVDTYSFTQATLTAGTYVFDIDQVLGAGLDNYVMTYDNTGGLISLEALPAEVNDLTAAVTWANVPDANITETSVTQHVGAIDHDSLLNFTATEHFTQAAISIPLSQGANDVTATATEVNLLDLAGLTVGWVLSADSPTTASWKAPTGGGGAIGGSITDNQIAVGATTANDIEGSAGLTWDGTTLDSTGVLTLFKSGGQQIQIGNGSQQLLIEHDGATGLLNNTAGNFVIQNRTNGAFMRFSQDDSGGTSRKIYEATSEQTELFAASATRRMLINQFGVQIDNGDLIFAERADHSSTPAATFGYLWVRNDIPNVLVFTDDAGTDTVLGAGGSGDLWSDPVDSSITVDTDSTYDIGTVTDRHATIYADNFSVPNNGNFLYEGGATFGLKFSSVNEWAFRAARNGTSEMFYNNVAKLQTQSAGIDVIGDVRAQGDIEHNITSTFNIRNLGSSQLVNIVTEDSGGIPHTGISVGGTTPLVELYWDAALRLSTSATGITVTGTQVDLGNFSFDIDQTVGVGQDKYVLTYDNGTGLISLEAAAGGGNIGGSITDNQIAVGATTADDIEGSSSLTWDGSILNVDGNIQGTTGFTIYSDVQTSFLNLSGSVSGSNGANQLLYGNTHATAADRIEFRRDSTTLGGYSGDAAFTGNVAAAAGEWVFGTATGGTGTVFEALRIDQIWDVSLRWGALHVPIDAASENGGVFFDKTGTTKKGQNGIYMTSTTGSLIFKTSNVTAMSLTAAGQLLTTASTATRSGFNIPPGVAPTTPSNGDHWIVGAAYNVRLNGVTVDLAAGGGGGSPWTYTLQSGAYTAAAGDFVAASSTGSQTITLPSGHSVNDTIIVKKTGVTSGGNVTVDGNASETIDGSTTYTLTTQYESITLISDGTNWLIV